MTMKALRQFVCAGFVTVLLSGCSYFHGEMVKNDQGPAVEIAEDILRPAQSQTSSNTQAVEVFGSDAGANAASVLVAGNNIEIFPIDGDASWADDVYATRQKIESNSFKLRTFSKASAPVQTDAAPALVKEKKSMTSAAAAAVGDKTVSRVYFSHDGRMLDQGDREALFEMSQNAPDGVIQVIGYSSAESSIKDPITRQLVNLRVSLDRAYEVSKNLIENGVPAKNILTSGWGEAHPAPATEDMSADAASRRVDVHVDHDQ